MTKLSLFTPLEETKVFRDPIHGYIHVDNALIYALICTPTFQRLRRIKQLGATYTVYSSAEHSRFSHSLGVYEIARRVVHENKYVAQSLTEEEKIYVQIAALLHDIGHGPYSHVFESLTHTSHETMTQNLLVQPSDIHDLLESAQNGLGLTIASLITHKYPKPLCWQLVSSQLDCDRMDYLLRDAYFTGTKYGEFDLERILRTIRVANDALVVKQSGIYAVENYLMARFHMFWQVYYHINIRCFESMLIAWNKRVMMVQTNDPLVLNYRHLIDDPMDLSAYLMADDATLNKILHKVANGQGDRMVLVDTALLNVLSFNFSSAVQDAFDMRALKGVAIGCGVFSALHTFSLCGNKFTVYPKCYCVADCTAVWCSQILGERSLNTLCLDVVCTVYSYGVFAVEPVVYAVSFPVAQYFSMYIMP